MVKDVFKQGDIVLFDFGPGLGHEQLGRRPGIVLSHESYNQQSGMMIAAPITSRKSRYRFDVEIIDERGDTKGIVAADQMKCIDVGARKPKLLGKISEANLRIIKGKLQALLIQD